MTTPSPVQTRSPSGSPEALQSLLALISSEDYTDQLWNVEKLAVTPLQLSGQSTPPLCSSIFMQVWRPCTGDFTIGRYLDARQFPTSYRDLGLRWKKLGMPALRTLHMPLNLRNFSTAASLVAPDLCEITQQQEQMVVEAIESHFDRGFSPQTQLFIGFASHLDIYCSVHAELTALEQGLSFQRNAKIYDEELYSLFLAFELDRAVCSARSSHDCIGHLLWGEMYSWPLAEIRRRFDVFKGRALRFAGLQVHCEALHPSRQSIQSAPQTPLSGIFPLPPFRPIVNVPEFTPGIKNDPDERLQSFPWNQDAVLCSDAAWPASTPPLKSEHNLPTVHGHSRSQSQPLVLQQECSASEMLTCEAVLRSAAARLDEAAQALSAKVAQIPVFPSRPRSKTTSDVCV